MIGIVILNYNNIEDTQTCISSIYKHCKKEDFKLCVVDNKSNKTVIEEIRNYITKNYSNYTFKEIQNGDTYPTCLPDICYILNNQNQGYANGNNIGLEFFQNYKDIHYFLILNNDVIFTMDILSPLRKELLNNLSIGVVSPLLYDKHGNIDYECARYEKTYLDIVAKISSLNKLNYIKKHSENNRILKSHPEYLTEKRVMINLPSGSCMMFRKEVFKDINFFDPNTFLYYEEDIIWQKLKKKGYKSILLPQISCIHLGAGSTSKSPSLFIRKAYRDSLMYYLKNWSGFCKIFIIYVTIRTWFNLKIKK